MLLIFVVVVLVALNTVWMEEKKTYQTPYLFHFGSFKEFIAELKFKYVFTYYHCQL